MMAAWNMASQSLQHACGELLQGGPQVLQSAAELRALRQTLTAAFTGNGFRNPSCEDPQQAQGRCGKTKVRSVRREGSRRERGKERERERKRAEQRAGLPSEDTKRTSY